MLTIVRDDETPSALEARQAAYAQEVARIASAPVQHVPAEFLLAVEGLFPELVRPRLRPVAAR
jgi:hypothetical protein